MGASLQADAAVVDVVVTIIITGANISSTTDRVNTTAITCRADPQLLDVTMARADFVAAMEEVVVMASALVLFAALPGTKPSSALRQVKHQCLSLRRFVVLKSISCYMNGHHLMMFNCKAVASRASCHSCWHHSHLKSNSKTD